MISFLNRHLWVVNVLSLVFGQNFVSKRESGKHDDLEFIHHWPQAVYFESFYCRFNLFINYTLSSIVSHVNH